MRRAPRAAALAALVLCGGCRVLVELVESDPAAVDGGAGADGAVGPDPSCGAWPFAPTDVDPCAIPAPGEAIVLGPGTWTYDTNSGALTDPAQDAVYPTSALIASPGGELRVISVRGFDVQAGAILRATGKRPLVVVAWTDLDVSGTIEVSSSATVAGAGANPSTCPAAGTLAGAAAAEGGGGGAGGGFASAGGAGGSGGAGAGAGGSPAAAVTPLDHVRGGCDGGRGGNAGGHGGHGGGALALIAQGTVAIAGTIDAGASGGGGAPSGRAGGGGAGAGGMIELDGTIVHLAATAVLASNGGGGGGGCDGGPAADGANGSAGATVASGGAKQGMGGDGGDGAFAQTAAQPGQPAARGGGGGGGGRGAIAVRATTLDDAGAIASPPLTRR
ncbi:MAG TPA: hypothetical protein VL463_13900 [Kofleriaceae bacterium]|nr:hypothetical protein [Kofleriaceae bacterium]